VFVSEPPLTVAAFVTLAGAVLATLTVSVKDGYVACAARASVRVHVTVWLLIAHVPQPVPAAAVGTRPEGTESVTVTVPLVAAEPPFRTVSV
jgi:hypothetical protein